MTEITIQKIYEAYSRFKAYIHYDNFNLTLRADLALYENDSNLNEKLLSLAKELSEYLKTGKLNERILKLIKDSNYIVSFFAECSNQTNSSQMSPRYEGLCELHS